MKPDHGYAALRRFRVSRPGADYFLTLCTNERKAGLTNSAVAGILRNEIGDIARAGYWTIRGAVIMPDHVHLLLTLHDRLSLGRAIARLKSRTKLALLLPTFAGREITMNTACAKRMPWRLFCSTFCSIHIGQG